MLSGVLTFYNSETEKSLRLFTTTDDSSKLSNIARIACSELGFKGVSSFSPSLVDSSKITDILNYVISNFYGLECDGTEKNIRECNVANNVTADQSFYELSVECYGTKNTINLSFFQELFV